MKNNYYQWRINYVINRHTQFKEWLLANDADIYAIECLQQGEAFKFRMTGGVGILYKTGKCNPFFNKIANSFKIETKDVRN